VGRSGASGCRRKTIPDALPTRFGNLTISGGPAPARAYIEELLPDVLEGRIEPDRVFDRIGSFEQHGRHGRRSNDSNAFSRTSTRRRKMSRAFSSPKG
jgi:hypothetical protein